MRFRPGVGLTDCAILAVIFLGLSLSGCSKRDQTAHPAAAEVSAASYKNVASIKELMDSTVDPSADGVWDAVGVVTTAAGTVKHEPRTDEDWHEVRRHAITLIEAMNLVLMPGRHAAPAETKAGLGELTPQQIDAAIAANRAEFELFATATRNSAEDALKAIDRRDTVALTRIGGELDERCESCHLTFWYPNSARPKS